MPQRRSERAQITGGGLLLASPCVPVNFPYLRGASLSFSLQVFVLIIHTYSLQFSILLINIPAMDATGGSCNIDGESTIERSVWIFARPIRFATILGFQFV